MADQHVMCEQGRESIMPDHTLLANMLHVLPAYILEHIPAFKTRRGTRHVH
ncbi:MAG: hypothetical protein NPIRA04_18000 [Nitrospirales bacterium]|nr:MAG: hypothetical protein NPIRA04_18000 [Nitrospirales bacterium]